MSCIDYIILLKASIFDILLQNAHLYTPGYQKTIDSFFLIFKHTINTLLKYVRVAPIKN